jgi:hypothetical protein
LVPDLGADDGTAIPLGLIQDDDADHARVLQGGVAAATEQCRRHSPGLEIYEGGALFLWLLGQNGYWTEAAEMTQNAWAESTFRKCKHKLPHFSRFLSHMGKLKELLTYPRPAVGCAMNFLPDAESRDETGSGVKVMAGHVL